MIHLDNIKKIVCVIFLMILSNSCSQSTKPAYLKWISKYDFYDIYQKNINNGLFPPVTGLDLRIFKFLDENTLFLAGSKDLYDFYNKPGDSAVLFVSKDRGKTFNEILFSEEKITFISTSKKYSLVETNSRGYSSLGKNAIYLLNNTTLQYKKIDEYSSNDNINYEEFNGEYVIYSKNKNNKLINLFTNKEYLLPDFLKDKNYTLEDSTFIYLDAKEILKYDIITKKHEVIKRLKDNYDSMYYKDGYFELAKLNFLKTEATIYNIDESEIYTSNEKTEKGLYRYKNFACKFKETRPYVTLCYSYDYGKTWYEYKTEKMFTTVTPKGYYKDKNILLDVCFYNKKDNTNIMIGEFQK